MQDKVYTIQMRNRNKKMKRRCRRKNTAQKRRLLCFITLLMVIAGVAALHSLQIRQSVFGPLGMDFGDAPTNHSAGNAIEDELYSPYAVLMRLSDGTIIMDKNGGQKMYPASLTKIMTAIVAIENLPDLDQEIVLSEKLFYNLYKENASMAGFQAGEQVKAIDLLYGTILPSGAECSAGLAIAVAGSECGFVDIMNTKAKELGMADTHFANVSGLHDPEHYSSAKDMAILLDYALQNETFRKIFTSKHHPTDTTNLQPDGITVYSTMFSKIETSQFSGGELLGGKTGYTEEAGLCLASLAKKGENEYILVTAGAAGDSHSERTNITDAFTVYETSSYY